MRIYYDREGHRAGYSLPLWLVAFKWLLVCGLIAAPVLLLEQALGVQHTTAGAAVAVAWTAFWLLAGRAALRAAR